MPSPNVTPKSTAKKTPDSKSANLGQKLAKKRSQDFKSKIEGWDGAGAGVTQAQDEIVVVEERDDRPKEDAVEVTVEVESDEDNAESGDAEDAAEDVTPASPHTPTSGLKASTKQGAQKKTAREIDVTRKAWVRRKSKPAAEATQETKRVVTPKKRIVSDGHWRRERLVKDTPTPEKEKEKAKEKDTTPKPVTVRRSVVSMGMKVPPSVQSFEESTPVRVRAITRRPRSASGVVEDDIPTPDYESSGVKVYIKRRKRSRERARIPKTFSTSESSLTAPSSFDRPSSATDITVPEPSPRKEDPPRPSTAPRERPSRRSDTDDYVPPKARKVSREAEDAPRRVSHRKSKPPAEETVPAKPFKPMNLYYNTRDPDEEIKRPTPVPKTHGTRIEGWLSEVPDDPFTQPSEPSLTPEPLDVGRRRSRRVENGDAEDDHGRRRSSGKVRRRRTRSLERDETKGHSRPSSDARRTVDDYFDESPTASPTLKRSGARRNTHYLGKDRATRGVSAQVSDSALTSDLPRRDSRRHTYNPAYSAIDDGPLPTNANRLPYSPSVDTLNSQPLPGRPRTTSIGSENPTIVPDGSVVSRASDGDAPVRKNTGLRRRMTKHSDLMSVLSLAREDGKPMGPRHRIPKPQHEPEAATIGNLMNELTEDELSYQRELRTLVDGVIPVLLQYVLSKSDKGKTPGSRSSSLQNNPALTQPIVDMGVALERLKASHKRIPMHDPNELLLWAQGTAKVYGDYLKSWRLGFSGIVVNLAPADDASKNTWDNGIPRTQQGDLLRSNGERVDVAYLLKRPLIRLKYLAKTLQSICEVRPSVLAEDMANLYDDLVMTARQRSNDEKARLEDEAAAAIDPSRARDVHGLAPLSGVHIDPSRSVRAKDFFDLDVFHSSGQQLGCKIELILRDDAPGQGHAGDVLFCEVSTSGRWLLFPPILSSNVSSRKGDKEGETVVMLRGMASNGSEWRELLSLQSSARQGAEWIQMLGSDPMPPRITRQSSFNTLRASPAQRHAASTLAESEVPIGERAKPTAPKWDGSEVNSVLSESVPPKRARAARYRSTPSSPVTRDESRRRFEMSGALPDDQSQYDRRTMTSDTRTSTDWVTDSGSPRRKNENGVWSDRGSDVSSDEGNGRTTRPGLDRRRSSVPSMDMPTVYKVRRATQPGKADDVELGGSSNLTHEEPASAPSKMQKRGLGPAKEDKPPQAPPHSKPFSLGLRSGALPTFTPAFLKRHRRSSSPLKHEYEPSTATESSSDSDFSDEEDVESITSESEPEEGVSVLGELKDFNNPSSWRPPSQPIPRQKSVSTSSGSVRPSDSASQAPYRTVPPASTNTGSAKSVACIFRWSDTGNWDSMHPEECEIVVTPGLIEAFDLAQAHAAQPGNADAAELSPSAHGIRPLVGLELTPLVPLRRGTALDISIRSPPTSNSLLRNGNNIMFRSRSPEECEKLYNLINRARIDNPTWIALQNARGPVPTSNWAEVMDRRNAERSNGGSSYSWMKSLSRKSTTYRSKGTRSGSIAGSQSSVGTTNSAFSALRRFSGSGSKIFNVAKSTITSKEGTRSSNSDSLSSGAATPIPYDPSMGTPMGITNTKIRLYIRESAAKWRDMGSARLTILLPPRPDPAAPADPRTAGLEKRVMIAGTKGNTLLDVTLGESCFERVARTGIAVSVWEESMHAAATGGVGSSNTKVYMVQMKSEREAAFTFSMVGKLRY